MNPRVSAGRRVPQLHDSYCSVISNLKFKNRGARDLGYVFLRRGGSQIQVASTSMPNTE
jgi:hypothetical protein